MIKTPRNGEDCMMGLLRLKIVSAGPLTNNTHRRFGNAPDKLPVVRWQCALEFYVTHMTRFQNSRFVHVCCIWLHFEYSSISRFS